MPRPLVTVRCLAYNHEPYIRECLEGFVKQETTFPVEFVIHDDASTDGTAAIISEYAEKYPDRITAILQRENQYSQRNGSIARILNENTRGKYIALCEGDDYWIDPLKLQKQVDFLEANPDYGMCHTRRLDLTQSTQELVEGISFENLSGSADELLECNYIRTLTAMYHTDLYFRYVEEVKPREKKWLMGDYPMWLWFAIKSKIYGLNEITAVYRRLNESACHSSDARKMLAFQLSTEDIKYYFIKQFKLNKGHFKLYKLYADKIILSIEQRNMACFKLAFAHLAKKHSSLLVSPRFWGRLLNEMMIKKPIKSIKAFFRKRKNPPSSQA